MYLSTQSYINQVEADTLIHRGGPHKSPVYPQEFDPYIAELFGYIVQCGTCSLGTVEINFADCHVYTCMVERIKLCYANSWNDEKLRLNSRNDPRICGAKNIGFICAVLGGYKYLRPGYEHTPEFVFNSLEGHTVDGLAVVKSYLKGVLGPCPKFWQVFETIDKNKYTGIRLFFRSDNLYQEVVSLLRYVLEIPFKAECGTLLFDVQQLQTLKQTIDLTDPRWWKNESWWTQIER